MAPTQPLARKLYAKLSAASEMYGRRRSSTPLRNGQCYQTNLNVLGACSELMGLMPRVGRSSVCSGRRLATVEALMTRFHSSHSPFRDINVVEMLVRGDVHATVKVDISAGAYVLRNCLEKVRSCLKWML